MGKRAGSTPPEPDRSATPALPPGGGRPVVKRPGGGPPATARRRFHPRAPTRRTTHPHPPPHNHHRAPRNSRCHAPTRPRTRRHATKHARQPVSHPPPVAPPCDSTPRCARRAPALWRPPVRSFSCGASAVRSRPCHPRAPTPARPPCAPRPRSRRRAASPVPHRPCLCALAPTRPRFQLRCVRCAKPPVPPSRPPHPRARPVPSTFVARRAAHLAPHSPRPCALEPACNSTYGTPSARRRLCPAPPCSYTLASTPFTLSALFAPLCDLTPCPHPPRPGALALARSFTCGARRAAFRLSEAPSRPYVLASTPGVASDPGRATLRP